jgi:hypothetical protein
VTRSLPFDTSEKVAEVAGNILRDSAAGEYPYLAEMAIDRVMKAGCNYGNEFEFGLDLILDGLKRVQDIAQRSIRSR